MHDHAERMAGIYLGQTGADPGTAPCSSSDSISPPENTFKRMNEHWKDATPLIVVGRQRAGTRFITKLLNSFPDVVIQGEIPNSIMKRVAPLIQFIDQYYLAEHAQQDNTSPPTRTFPRCGWEEKRRDLIFAIWANCTQTRRIELKGPLRYYGYKRPNNEFYFSLYEKSFSSCPPRYIYCLRKFRENFLSISSRWPDRTIEEVADNYCASLQQYLKMKEQAPDRVRLSVLELVVESGYEYIKSDLLQFLDLSPDARLEKKITEEYMAPTNQTEKIPGATRRRHLTEQEEEFLSKHPQMDDLYERVLTA